MFFRFREGFGFFAGLLFRKISTFFSKAYTWDFWGQKMTFLVGFQNGITDSRKANAHLKWRENIFACSRWANGRNYIGSKLWCDVHPQSYVTVGHGGAAHGFVPLSAPVISTGWTLYSLMFKGTKECRTEDSKLVFQNWAPKRF